MLKKKQRLTKKQFSEVFKTGKRSHSDYFQLIYNQTQPGFHGAAVVGKKVNQKAVDRNLSRRRIYGALYRFQLKSPLKGVYIIVAKPAIKSLNKSSLSAEVNKILKTI